MEQETHQKTSVRVSELVSRMGNDAYSVRELMHLMGLSDSVNFRKVYLGPAIKYEFVRLKYPDHPKHRDQKILFDR
ncbi:MAG: Fic family protein [Bacteroidales bacterium]|nr:hypothetical protein [Bacteroidales bacterium]